MTTTLAEVRAVAAEHRISRSGFLPNPYESAPDWSDFYLPMIDHARAFIRAGDREPYRCSEYSNILKHHAERWRGAGSVPGLTYVINGAFLVACYLEGLRPRRAWFEEPRSRRRMTVHGRVRLPSTNSPNRLTRALR